MAKESRLLSERYPELYAQIYVPLTYQDSGLDSKAIAKLTYGSGVCVCWRCPESHVWFQRIYKRTLDGRGCPFCSGQLRHPGVNSLKDIHPEVFAEIHPTLNQGIETLTLSPKGSKRIWWQCPKEPEHTWQATINQRTSGNKTGCPHCHNTYWRNETEFRNELNKYTNIKFIAGNIDAPRELFKLKTIRIDIINHEHKIAIEYDGHFSHGGNKFYKTTKAYCFARDTASTKAILDAGYSLIRIRETPLEMLETHHPNLFQITYKNGTDKAHTIALIVKLLNKAGKSITIV